MTIASVVDALHRIAPPELAEPWDNVGLLLGDPAAPCTRALVALDADAALLRRAAAARAQLLITHHPPLFTPVRRLTAADPTGRLLLDAARRGIALAAAHTNYDIAPGGVNDVLAGLLGLCDTEPLASPGRPQAKLVVFAPPSDFDPILRALDECGAGVIGRYRQCSFRAPGTGTFLPLEGAHPTLGEVGRREETAEVRIEAIVPLALARRAAEAVRAAHSYEEPAIDIVPLGNPESPLGLGRCGRLAKPVRADRFVAAVKERLRVSAVRVVGDLRRRVERVAVCGGSGGDYIAAALCSGCQLYVTGDLKHHQALAAAAEGLIVVDAGHAATEAPAIPPLARRLAALCPEVRFTPVPVPPDGPFRLM